MRRRVALVLAAIAMLVVAVRVIVVLYDGLGGLTETPRFALAQPPGPFPARVTARVERHARGGER